MKIKFNTEKQRIELISAHVEKATESKVNGGELFEAMNTVEIPIEKWGIYPIYLVPMESANAANMESSDIKEY